MIAQDPYRAAWDRLQGVYPCSRQPSPGASSPLRSSSSRPSSADRRTSSQLREKWTCKPGGKPSEGDRCSSEPALNVLSDLPRSPGALALPFYEQALRQDRPLKQWFDALVRCIPKDPEFHKAQRELLRREEKADWTYVTKLLTSGGGWRLQGPEPSKLQTEITEPEPPAHLSAPTPGSTRPVSLPPRSPVEVVRDLVGSLWRLSKVELQRAPHSQKTFMAVTRDEHGKPEGFVKFSAHPTKNERSSTLRRLESDLKSLWLTQTLGQLQVGLPVGFACFVALRDKTEMPWIGFQTPYWQGFAEAARIIAGREESICEELRALIYRAAGAGVLLLDLKPQNLVFGGTPAWRKKNGLALVRFIDFDATYALATVVPVGADDALSYDVRLGSVVLMMLLMLAHLQLAETRQLTAPHPPVATPEELETWRRERGARLDFCAHATAQLRRELVSLRAQHPWQCLQTLLAQLPPEHLRRVSLLCTSYFVKPRDKSKRDRAYFNDYNTIFKVIPPNTLDLHTPCPYVTELLGDAAAAFQGEARRDRVELGKTVDIHAARVYREIEHLVHAAGEAWPEYKSCEDFLCGLTLSCRRASYDAARRRLRGCNPQLAASLLPHKKAAKLAQSHLEVPWQHVDRRDSFNFERRLFASKRQNGSYVFYPPGHILAAATSDAQQTATLLFETDAMRDAGLHQLRACASAWLYAVCYSSMMKGFSLRSMGRSEVDDDEDTYARYIYEDAKKEEESGTLILKLIEGAAAPGPREMLWLRKYFRSASATVLRKHTPRLLQAVRASLGRLRASLQATSPRERQAVGCGVFEALLKDGVYEDEMALSAFVLRGDLLSGVDFFDRGRSDEKARPSSFGIETPVVMDPIEDLTPTEPAEDQKIESWTAAPRIERSSASASGPPRTPSRNATSAKTSRRRTRASPAS